MTLRERLRRLEQRLSALRDQRADRRTAYTQAAQALADAPEDGDTYNEALTASRTAREELEATQEEIEQLEEQRAELLRQIAADQRPGDDPDGDRDRLGVDPDDVERIDRDELRRSVPDPTAWARRAVRSDTAQALARIAHSRTAVNRQSLGEAADRREFLAALDRDDLAGLVQPDRRGLIEPTLRPLTFLDFLPFAGTDSNSVQYVSATTLPSDAAPVAPTVEGAVKPEMGPLVLEDVDDPIRTIAAWTKQKRQVLDDAPFLEGLLRQLLVYEVRRALSAQLIAGDGTGENVLGLLNRPNVLTYVRGTVDPAENIADAILQGVVEVEDHDREPQLVMLNPRDRARVRLMKDADGNYLFGPPSQAGASTVWDYMMVPERSIPVGTALVADPAGALGLLRSGVEVLVSDSDQDDFIRNRITLLAELRAGLAVLRPDAFCKVDITEPTP